MFIRPMAGGMLVRCDEPRKWVLFSILHVIHSDY